MSMIYVRERARCQHANGLASGGHFLPAGGVKEDKSGSVLLYCRRRTVLRVQDMCSFFLSV